MIELLLLTVERLSFYDDSLRAIEHGASRRTLQNYKTPNTKLSTINPANFEGGCEMGLMTSEPLIEVRAEGGPLIGG